MAFNFRTLLGAVAPRPTGTQSLLGEFYDPRALGWSALGGALQGAGAGLASGKPGAWATGLIGGANDAVDEYGQKALLGYEMKQKADDRAYNRDQDQKTWDWRASQAAEEKRRWEVEQERAARAAADNAAWQSLVRQNTQRGWAEADALRQGQTNAVNQWSQGFKSQGGDLFSPEMQAGLREQGIAGVDPSDTIKYRQAQPFMQAGDVGRAFNTISAPTPEMKAPTVQTFYENGQEVKKQWRNGRWEQVGGAKPPSEGIVIRNADGSETRIGGSGGGKMTEGDKRMRLLGRQALTQEPIVNTTFDSMSDPRNLAGTSVPGGRLMMTPEGKQATDAISNTIAAWLYALSGATATDEEVRKRTAEVLPAFGDDAGTLANKKARLRSYYDGLRDATSMFPDAQAAPQADGATVAPKVRVYNPATGKLEDAN